MKVGIFGTELISVNYGCSALGLVQLQYIEEIAVRKNINVEYYIFSNDDALKVEKIKKELNIKSKIEIKKLINFRDGIKGMKYILNEIDKCDLIIDLTYGDSFSDIYGIKTFILYSIPKLMTIYKKKDFIIAPQTIGPYKNIFVEMIAKKILKKSKYLCVRDEKSLDYAKKLTNRNDIILVSDLAMELPYSKRNFKTEKFKVGLNISELLWDNTNDQNSKQYGIVIDYKELVRKIISRFLTEQYEVHLITHVYAKDETKGEYALAKRIHNEFPETILAPKFDSPIEAKSYMSGLDLFFGARMHATMGAFSSGVPIIPTSYSRKFEGLYGSLGYNYGINLREITSEEAMNHIEYCLENYDKLEKDRQKAFIEALDRNKKYHKLFEEIIK